jgi:hypothetical protein
MVHPRTFTRLQRSLLNSGVEAVGQRLFFGAQRSLVVTLFSEWLGT